MGRWGSLLQRLRSDKLLRTTAWMFASFMAGGVFNYGFQIAMGRMLPPAEFGLMNALLGLSVVFGVPTAALVMVVARKTAAYNAKGETDRVRRLVQRVNRFVFKAGTAGLIVFLLSSGAVAGYVRSPSLAPVWILAACLVTSILVPMNTAVLQGLQEYKWFGVMQGVGGPARFLFSTALVFAGFGVSGALGGILASNVALWLLAAFPVRRRLKDAAVSTVPDPIAWRLEASVLVANLAFVVMTQMDMVLVRHYFPPAQAALYASAAVLGRVVMYIPGSLVLAMFPIASEQKALNVDGRPLLLKSLLMTLGLSGAVAALFFLAPGWTLGTFFGGRYLPAAGLLKYFGLAMLPMALLLVTFNYMVARGRKSFSYVMLGAAALEVLLIHFHHGTPSSVVGIIAVSGTLPLLAGLARVWAVRRPSEVYRYGFA